MFIFVATLILIISVLIILVVLIQDSKGGGLTSNLTSQNQMLGVKRTTDFLEKTTWTLAIALVVLSLSTSFMKNSRDAEQQIQSEAAEQIENAPLPTQALPAATTQDAGQQTEATQEETTEE